MSTSYFYIIFVTKDYSRTAGSNEKFTHIIVSIVSLPCFIQSSKLKLSLTNQHSHFELTYAYYNLTEAKLKTRSTTVVSDL